MTDFDPAAHVQALRDCPQDFVSMVSIASDAKALHAIRRAGTMESLNATSQPLLRAAKAAGDTVLFDILKAAAGKRKGELTK